MKSSILLAAGLSSRMGTPKSLLRWGEESLAAYQVRQLFEAGCDEVVVVLGYRADEIARELRRLPCRIMLNPRFHLGRAGSLRIGAKAMNRDAESVVILNVDQPRPAKFIRDLMEAHATSGKAITRPVCDGHGGHPVIVAGRLRGELMEARDESGGLREIIEAHRDELNDVPSDELARLDVNTPDDYASALKRFSLAPA